MKLSKAQVCEANQSFSFYRFETFYKPFESKKFTVVWNKPEEANGPIHSYILKGTCAKSECVNLQLNGNLSEYVFESDVNPESFEILAKNSDSLVGEPASISLTKAPFKPMPKLLTLDSSNVLELMNLARNQKQSLHHLSWTPDLFSFNAVNNEVIMLSQHQSVFQMDVETRIIKDTGIMLSGGDGPKVFDAISQSIYWPSNNEIHRVSIENGKNMKIGSVSDIIEGLAISTQDNSVIFYATINGGIGAYNLTNGINYDNIIKDNCHLDGPFLSSMAASGKTLNFIEKITAKAWIFDMETKSCLLKGNLPTDLALTDLTILNDQVFWLNSSSNHIWSLQYGEHQSEATITKMIVFCSTCQSLPQVHKKCLHHSGSVIQIVNVTSSSASLQIPAITSKCDIVLPLTKIVIILNDSSEHEFIMNNSTSGMITSLDNLAPSTKYFASVFVRNDLGYFEMNQTITFETLQGPPNPPKDLEVLVLSPQSLQVSWKAINGLDVSYEVHYMVENVIQVKKMSKIMAPKRIRKFHFTESVTIVDLDPNTEYQVWIEARNSNNKMTKSAIKVVKTMEPPNLVEVLKLAPRFMQLRWRASEEDMINQHQIVIESANGSTISIPELPHPTQAKQSYTYNISDLSPGTEYCVRVLVTYKTSVKGVQFKWPQDNTNMIITPPSKPLTPGQPYPLESLSDAKIFLAWKPNDLSVTLYQLQYMEITNQSSASNWSTLYEDSQTKWQISGLTDGLIQFRVRAENPFGWSEWSEESIPIDVEKILLQLSSQQSQVGLIVGGSFTGFALLVIIFILFTLSLKYGNSEKKALLGLPSASVDHQELAVMR